MTPHIEPLMGTISEPAGTDIRTGCVDKNTEAAISMKQGIGARPGNRKHAPVHRHPHPGGIRSADGSWEAACFAVLGGR